MAIDTELLEEIGLTKAEINVYLALLELGSSTTGPIVEKSRASSSKIYEILEKLMQKGLVSFVIKSNVKYFEAADPKRIIDYMEEKRTELEQKTIKIKRMLPELELKKTLAKYKNEATVYKGMKGLETAFEELLDTGKGTNYVFVVGEMDDRLNEFFKKLYIERARRGIKTKTIFSEAGRKYYESRKGTPLFEGKVIGTTTSPATINIYKSKVNIRIGTSREVLCLMIENQELADSFLEQFNVLWNQDITISKGMDVVIQTLKNFVDEIKPGDTFDALGAAFGVKGSEQQFAQEFAKYHAHRLQKGIRARWLFQSGVHNIIEKNKQNYEQGEIKFLPYDLVSPVSIHPYKDKTLLIVQEKDPTVITINNTKITEAFHRQFESLWNQDVNVYKGFDAVTHKFCSMLDGMNEQDEYIVLGASHGQGGEKLKEWFMGYHRRRMGKKIKVKMLAVAGDYFDIIPQLNQAPDKGMTLARIKQLPPEFTAPMQINLYPSNKVLMFLWGKELLCFEIESKILHQNFNAYFEGLWNQEMKTYHGYEGLKTIISETLQYSEVLFIGAGGYVPNRMPQFWKAYNTKRLQQKILWKGLAREEVIQSSLMKEKYFEFKLMPKAYQTPNVIWIFGNKVVNILWTETPIAFAIENAEVAKSYREYFNYLWKIIK